MKSYDFGHLIFHRFLKGLTEESSSILSVFTVQHGVLLLARL